MTATTVTGKLTNPAGMLPSRGAVAAVLIDYLNQPVVGFDPADHTTILSTLPIPVNSDGTWTVALIPNASIQLANGSAQTAWRITETGGGADGSYLIIVPPGGPYWVGDLRTTLVGPAPSTTPTNLAVSGALTVGGTFTLDGTAIGAPPGGTTKYLGADGAWRIPAGAVGGVSSFNGLTGDVVAGAATVGALGITQNLSDLGNPVTARTNLGLGAAAVAAIGTASGTVAAGDDSRVLGAVQKSTLTTKGDLYVSTGPGTVARFPTGADGQLLTPDSAQSAGLRWTVVTRDPSASKLGLVVQPFPIEACNRVGLGLSSNDLISPMGVAAVATAVTRIGLWLTAAGAGPTGGSYAVFLDEAGTVLASSADITSQLADAGNVGTFVELVLTASAPVTAGTNYRPSILTQMSTNPKTAGTLVDDGSFLMPTIRGHRPSVFVGGLSSVPSSVNIATASTAFAGYYITALDGP